MEVRLLPVTARSWPAEEEHTGEADLQIELSQISSAPIPVAWMQGLFPKE
jgi:hypothetical protein